jgi:hypothetical protein
LSLVSQDQTLNQNFASDIKLSNDMAAQQSISNFFNQLSTADAVTTTVGIKGVTFGLAQEPIDTFSKLQFSVPLNPVVQPIKQAVVQNAPGFIDQLKAGLLNPPPAAAAAPTGVATAFMTKDVQFKVTSPNSLMLSADAQVQVPFKVNVNMPFTQVNAQINGQDFVLPNSALSFQDGALKFKSDLSFKQNDTLVNNFVADTFGVVTGNKDTSKTSLTITGISFGASPESAFNLLSQASITAPLDPALFIARDVGGAVIKAQLSAPATAVAQTFTVPPIQGSLQPNSVNNLIQLQPNMLPVNVPVMFTGKASFAPNGNINAAMPIGSAQFGLDVPTGTSSNIYETRYYLY